MLVGDDDQLLHLTRYIHLNPTSANLVKNPENWPYSSFNEYINSQKGICNFEGLFIIIPNDYKNFVDNRKDYQKQLSVIKLLTIDDYSG